MSLYTCSNRKQQKSTVELKLTRNANGDVMMVLYRNGEIYRTRVFDPAIYGRDMDSIIAIISHVNVVEKCGVKDLEVVS